ncbi:MAG: DUF4169 family protein [Pseudomonadota bacterium]
MSAKILNLRAARKNRARQKAKETAAENAARHGATKTEKTTRAAEIKRLSDKLDNHKRDP